MTIALNTARIDVHAHYLPARYLEMLRAAGGRVLSPAHDEDTLAHLVAGQDAAGVQTQVLSTGPHSPYLHDASAAIACAHEINDSYAAVVDRSGGRFAAFGSVPLPHVGPASAEGCRCLDELGFAGIHLGCSILGRPLDDPEFDEFWQELDRREAIVFVHPGGVLMGAEPGLAGMDDPMLAVVIGSAAEVATTTMRLIGLRRRHARIRFVICILGGVLPYLYKRLDHAAGAFGKKLLGDMQRPLIEELRGFYYDTTLDDDVDALIKARDLYGADRLLLGSDAPKGTPAAAIDFVRAAGFPVSECNAILDRNAADLLAHRLRRP
ncbi:MAG: amidohydrolase family protein [Pseudomonadota bacterium]